MKEINAIFDSVSNFINTISINFKKELKEKHQILRDGAFPIQ